MEAEEATTMRTTVRAAAPRTPPGTLGERLRALRVERGLSQTELAGDILSPSAVSLLESGRREPTDKTLRSLAERLGSTTEYLRYGTEPGDSDTARLAVLVPEMWAHAGDHERALRLYDEVLESQRLSLYLVRRARFGRATALEHTGRVDEAIAELEDIRGGGRTLPWLDVDAVLTTCYRKVSRHRECLELATAAVQLAEGAGLRGTASHSKLVINLIHELHEQNKVAESVRVAMHHLDDALVSARPERAVGYRDASLAAADAGRTAEALLLAERALNAYEMVADARDAALLRTVAAIAMMANRPGTADAALRALGEAHSVLEVIGSSADLAFVEMGLAGTAMQSGDDRQATHWAELALRHGDDGVPRSERAFALIVLARGHHARGDVEAARADAAHAREVLAALPPNRRSALAWREFGIALRLIGDTEAAFRAYESALEAVQVGGVFPL